MDNKAEDPLPGGGIGFAFLVGGSRDEPDVELSLSGMDDVGSSVNLGAIRLRDATFGGGRARPEVVE